MFIDFRERGREGEREREGNIDVREKHQGVVSCTQPMEPEPTTQACTPAGNRTCDLLVHGMMLLQPNELHWPGLNLTILGSFIVPLNSA